MQGIMIIQYIEVMIITYNSLWESFGSPFSSFYW